MLDMYKKYRVAVVKDFCEDENIPYAAKSSLACCKPAPAEPCKKACIAIKKEEYPMASLSAATVAVTSDALEIDQRRSLRNRASDAFYARKSALKKQFGLIGDDAPETIKDVLARIAEGKFVVKEKYEDDSYYNFFSRIVWRDPAIVEDKDGYKAARAELQDAFEKLDIRLKIIPLQEALAEFEAFRDAK